MNKESWFLIIKHIFIVMSIGSAGSSLLFNQFVLVVYYNHDITWTHVVVGIICLIISFRNLFNFKFSENCR